MADVAVRLLADKKQMGCMFVGWKNNPKPQQLGSLELLREKVHLLNKNGIRKHLPQVNAIFLKDQCKNTPF